MRMHTTTLIFMLALVQVKTDFTDLISPDSPYCTLFPANCKTRTQIVLSKSDNLQKPATVLTKSDNLKKTAMLQMWPIFAVHVVLLMAFIILMGK